MRGVIEERERLDWTWNSTSRFLDDREFDREKRIHTMEMKTIREYVADELKTSVLVVEGGQETEFKKKGNKS